MPGDTGGDMMTMGKTPAERLAAAKAKTAKKAHQDRMADKKYVADLNKQIRKGK